MRRGISGRWFSTLVVSGLGIALAAGTGWMLSHGTRGAEIANIWALPVSLIGVLIAAFGWSFRGTAGGGRVLAEVADGLALRVAEREAVALRRLLGDIGDVRPADLMFTRLALGSGWRSDGGDPEGTVHAAAAYFRGLDRGRLVVLGEPGAGKTIMAIALVLDLVREPPDDGVRRVPIRLSPSSFSAGTLRAGDPRLVRERLDDWIVEALASSYGIGPRVGRELVAQGRIIPVLDGLDEMGCRSGDPGPGELARSSPLESLLTSLNWPTGGVLRPVVVTCRSDRYLELVAHDVTVVQDATVVEMRPLSTDRVTRWITRLFPDPDEPTSVEGRWRPVVKRLDKHPRGRLAVGLSSPLRLFLAVAAYRSKATRPEELLAVSAADLDDHLFARLVPSITAHHPRGSGHYRADQVTRWLTTIADHLDTMGRQGRSRTDFRAYDLWQTSRRARSIQVLTACATLFPLIPVLVMWLVTTPAFASTWFTGIRWSVALALAGILVVSVAGFASSGDGPTSPWPVTLPGRGVRGNPGEPIRRGLRQEVLCLLGACTAGGAVGTSFGSVVLGVLLGAAAAPALGTAARGHATWLRYLITVAMLSRRHAFPIRSARFLDWAWQAGLIRISGGRVQFRHQELQSWLGRSHPPRTAPPLFDQIALSALLAQPAEDATGQRTQNERKLRVLGLVVTALAVTPSVLLIALVFAGTFVLTQGLFLPAVFLLTFVVLVTACALTAAMGTLWSTASRYTRMTQLARTPPRRHEGRDSAHDVGGSATTVQFAMDHTCGGLCLTEIPGFVDSPDQRTTFFPLAWPISFVSMALLPVTTPRPVGSSRSAFENPSTVVLLMIASAGVASAFLRIRSHRMRSIIEIVVPFGLTRLPADIAAVMVLHSSAHLRLHHVERVRWHRSVRLVSALCTAPLVGGGVALALDLDRLTAGVLLLLLTSGACAVTGLVLTGRLLELLLELRADSDWYASAEVRAAVMRLLTQRRRSAMADVRLRALAEGSLPVTVQTALPIASMSLAVLSLAGALALLV
ncbi:NACHT domain-containing protein [Actinosynnema sp. NPDC050436]|uniref:NACHT domain-containing protein n=1 Tax=Actinosynnema sp. NPDC050436 TaxID=3155659 RepID=UPI003411739B